MAKFSPKEIVLSTINNGKRFEDGDCPYANSFNDPIEASAYAQSLSKSALAKADQALQYALGGGASNLPVLSARPPESLYLSVGETTPAELFGGTWEKIKDVFLLASGDTYPLGSVGGSADAVVVAHTHNGINIAGAQLGWAGGRFAQGTDSAGFTGGVPENITINSEGVSGVGKNMPPYLAISVWVRIA